MKHFHPYRRSEDGRVYTVMTTKPFNTRQAAQQYATLRQDRKSIMVRQCEHVVGIGPCPGRETVAKTEP